MSHAVIRAASVKDIQELAVVHVKAWQWAYRGLIPEVLDSLDVELRAASWARMLREGAAPPHIALDAAGIVGFVHAGTSRDEGLTQEAGEVTALYLDPDYVRMGFGYRLWSAALDQLRAHGHTAVTVWVLSTNQRGKRFYKKMGLTPDGAHKEQSLGGTTLMEIRYSSPLTA